MITSRLGDSNKYSRISERSLLELYDDIEEVHLNISRLQANNMVKEKYFNRAESLFSICYLSLIDVKDRIKRYVKRAQYKPRGE